jgi:hypothetical protein
MAAREPMRDKIRQQLMYKLDVSARGLNGKVGALAKNLAISADGAPAHPAWRARGVSVVLDRAPLKRTW